jgi:two-component system, OmpR family, KDP operon response regulator KdpE
MPENSPTVLIIEDEPQIRRFLRASLNSQGYKLYEATTAKEGLAEAAAHPPEVVLLDLGLPDMDGLEVISRLREWLTAPIIIISARGQEGDKVAALDSGADDYLTKPFGVAELMARLRVALRHSSKAQANDGQTLIEIGRLKVDLTKRLVFLKDEELKLTPIEFKLLTFFVKHAGKVLTHRQISQEVWGPNYAEENHSLRVFIYQLRHKVEENPAQPRYLITEAGIGYRLRI